MICTIWSIAMGNPSSVTFVQSKAKSLNQM
jgi:hypothetical protein